MIPPNTLRNGWSELLLRYEWQWFCTFTFREPTHPERADKLFRVWVSRINRNLFGPRWHRTAERGVFWIRGLEWQKRDVLHYHALMGCVFRNLDRRLSRRFWAEAWQDMAGFARIETIRSQADTASYVTKYTTKGSEIDFSNNLGTVREIEQEFEIEAEKELMQELGP